MEETQENGVHINDGLTQKSALYRFATNAQSEQKFRHTALTACDRLTLQDPWYRCKTEVSVLRALDSIVKGWSWLSQGSCCKYLSFVN